MWCGLARAFHVYRRAFVEVRPFWPMIGLILALGLVAIPISLLMPLPLKIIVDNVLDGRPLAGPTARLVPTAWAADPHLLMCFAIGFSVALAMLALAHRLCDWLLRETVADRMVHSYRGKLFLHGLRLPTLHHAAAGTHDLGYRLNQDAPALQWTAIYGLVPVVISLSTLASTFYVTAAISLKLAVLALATALPTMGLVHLWQGRLKAKWHDAKEQESAAQSIIYEVLGALRTVTVFGQERRETTRYLTQSQRGIAARHRAIRVEAALGALLSVSTALGTAAILYLGVTDVQSKALSIGDLLVVITYIGQLYGPLQAIGTHFTGQQHAVASAERTFAVLDQPLEITDGPGALPRTHALGDVSFRNVSFAYDARHPVLRDVSFEVPAGACVGILGRTGAGKTTLVNMLIRLFDPEAGSILLDGVDLRDWRLADLRRQFAVLPQEPVLFSTTIAENIAYARPDAPLDDIVAAARLANAHDFITSLPEGYATRVGERGLRLSGGERQRIALARAFLKDAPLLILDEPTSAIDRETETAILEGMERLMRGRTTFIVTHRLAALRWATMRLAVDDGAVHLLPDPFAADLRKVS
jgi:ATP-binding cassette subfamily B protein